MHVLILCRDEFKTLPIIETSNSNAFSITEQFVPGHDSNELSHEPSGLQQHGSPNQLSIDVQYVLANRSSYISSKVSTDPLKTQDHKSSGTLLSSMY